ncbi:hypothetical protein HKD37_10G028449 [Glycine soja]
MGQPGPVRSSRMFLQKAVASGGSNLARLGKLGGKLLQLCLFNKLTSIVGVESLMVAGMDLRQFLSFVVLLLIITDTCSGFVCNSCNLCICVALLCRLNSIVKIDDQKETWKIVVRVINMWTIPRSPKSIVELILVDKKGDKILAQMKNVDVQLDNVIIDVGQNYVIQNFEVEKNSGHYKAAHHGFTINFVKATKVTPHKILEIPETMYNFIMFDDIILLVRLLRLGNGICMASQRKLSIMSCTLWGSMALEFKDCFDRHVYGLVVLLLSLAKIKEARDRFLHNAHVKHFYELIQLRKNCMCVIVATISKLLVANGWIYDDCPKCNKKANGEGSLFVCVGCGNKSATTVPKVGQPHESAFFTLWDRECYALIKETAKMIDEVKNIDTASLYASCMDNIVVDGVFDARDIPEELDYVLSKRLTFRFKLSDDYALIKFVLSKLPTLQHEKCFSATVESNPTLLGSITLAKHILPLSHSQLDGILFKDLSLIQLSSTRLGKKHIKTENTNCRNVPFAGERGRGSRVRFPKEERCAESPPTFICGKRQENRRKPVDKSGAFAPTYPPLERKSDLRSSFLCVNQVILFT